MSDIEEWRDIPNYEGLYQVSSFGRVKSLPKYKCKTERMLVPYTDKDGYKRYTLCPNNKDRCRFFAHRLVGYVFIGNPDRLPEIDHIDGDPSNNHVSNLRWCTHKENSNNPITRKRKSESKKGLIKSEETRRKLSIAHKGRKLQPHVLAMLIEKNRVPVIMMGLDGTELKRFGSIKSGAEYLGIDQRRISEVLANRNKTAGGYKWKRA